jgi:hypothetical protein
MIGEPQWSVHVMPLWRLMPVYELNLTGDEVEAIRDLYCAVPENENRRSWSEDVRAAESDISRWREATEELLAVVARLREQEDESYRRLRGPRRGPVRRLWGRARRDGLRQEHEALMERLRAELLAAYRRFRDRSGDLTEYVKAERERREREMRERDREREEEKARRRAEALARPLDAPRWSYRVTEPWTGKYHRFEVCLEPLDEYRRSDGEARGGLTPQEVHAALVEERERDPYVWFTFGLETEEALEEWRGDTRTAWRELTGEQVDPYPTRPEDRRSSRSYGPSSTYYGGPDTTFGSIH